MQTNRVQQEEPPLVEINHRGQTFETYVVSTDAVAEAAYLIREVLVDDCYLKHGLQITPGATVVDIGANIGLFGVRALSAVPGGDVSYAGVEPVPANFTALQYNLLGSTCRAGSTGSTASAAAAGCTSGSTSAGQSFFHFNAGYAAAVAPPTAGRISSLYPGNILLFNKAVSNQSGTLSITFYPRMPGNSTLRPLEKAALQQHLMPSFFSAVEQFEVHVITLQQLLQEAVPDGRRVDLLKVDVEGEELAVLQGLSEAGWSRVQQVVVEVHDCLVGEFDEHPVVHAAATKAEGQGKRIQAAPGAGPPSGKPAPASKATAVASGAVSAAKLLYNPGAARGVAAAAENEPAVPGQQNADITSPGDSGISILPGDLPGHDESGRPVMRAAAPPRPDGRVMAVARMLRGFGFTVVVECCMLLEGAPASYHVYARRP